MSICVLLTVIPAGCSAAGGPSAQPAPQRRVESPTSPPANPVTTTPAPIADQGLRITLDGKSEARYRAQEVLARLRIPSEAVGRTPAVTGAIVLDSTGRLVAPESKIKVDLRQLRSDQGLRDRFIQTDVMQTNRFPNAEFAGSEVRGLAWPAPTSGEVKFQLAGDLTVHGVTRPAMWDVVAKITGAEIAATASTRAKITDFGMQIPRVPTVLSLEDELTLEVETKTTRG